MTKLAPTNGVVDIWRVPLNVNPASYAPWLDAADRERAARRLGVERSRFVACHGALRRIASMYSDSRVTASYGRRPHCPGIDLSLAHADELAVISVAEKRVGIDIEPVGAIPQAEVDDMADFVLGPSERAAFARCARGERAHELLRLWTRKEACLKATGQGIGDRPLADVNAQEISASGATVLDIAPHPGFIGAVAVLAPRAATRWQS